MKQEIIKLNAGKVRVPVMLIYDDDEERITVKFKYNKLLVAEIKNMEGRRWHGSHKWATTPPRKEWSIANTPRNQFQLAYLQGLNPYEHWDSDLVKHKYVRPLREHQIEFSDFMLTRRQVLLAAEMGSGKTLSAIEVMERSGFLNWFYVAPKSALMSVQIEFKKWDMTFRPRTMTYEGLTKLVREWKSGQRAPQGVIFDESARVKNPTSQRSQAALHLADSMRKEYGLDAFVILMSGAPAPKTPVDWYHQCEIACPGFLKEGNVSTFKQRLAIIVDRESVQGGKYPHIVSWLDDSKKCATCGEFYGVGEHQPSVADEWHKFVPSKNEVAYLGERMSGLVHVKFLKDCITIPDKQYRQIAVEPTQKIINAAQGIVSRAKNVASAITKLRTLSDGFIYRERTVDEVSCPVCRGVFDNRPIINNQRYCDRCDNAGKIKKTIREAQQIDCPKEQVVIDLLDEYIDVGRVVFYAGFTGSITRLVDICKKCGWETVKADGHGWKTSFDGDPLDVFQNCKDEHPRVAFIGQPGAAGTGLTLTASPVIIYYSNDFDADHRIQSEARCHRMGMDINRGCMIIDIFHLPTDELVYNNLKKKRAMQSLTLNELNEVLSC